MSDLPIVYLPPSKQADRLTRLAGEFLAGYPNKNTRTGYARELRRWFAWCELHNVDVVNARRVEVETFMRQLEETMARNSVCRIIGALASFYRFLVFEEHIVASPMQVLKRPQKDMSPKQTRLTRHDLLDMLTVAEDGTPSEWALVSLLTLNALRVSEAVGTNITDLSEDHWHHTLAIWGKGDKPDVVPLHPRCMLAITAATKGRSEGPIMLNQWGNRMSRANAQQVVKRVAKLAGIDKRVTPHTFRHGAITAALNAGVPMRDVQSFARHADPKTTMHYDRHRHSLERHATYNVAQFIAGAD
jgi:integrase/recombinase XerD